MSVPTTNMSLAGEMVAVVFILGFAIQQVLTILDPFVNGFLAQWKKRIPPDFPGGMSEGDFKKVIMALLAFGLGLLAAWVGDIRLLRLLDPKTIADKEIIKCLDIVVSALVMGSGTEAVNTFLKYIGYIKDARKPAPEVTVSVTPSTKAMKPNESWRFTAAVQNAPHDVTWTVLDGAGGSVNEAGNFTAPATPGQIRIAATSKAAPSNPGIAVITVA